MKATVHAEWLNDKDQVVKNLNDALSIATTLTRSWFRGHSCAVNQLVPRIFRGLYGDCLFRQFRPEFELWTIENFKRHASVVSERGVPGEDDRWGGCV